MPVRAAVSTIRRTVRAPARCPAERAKPRRSAQRPLPSMMIATCIVCLWPFGCLDQSFEVLEMAGEHPSSFGREAVFRLRDARRELLLANDVARVLELTSMHAQVAVARLQELLELGEAHTRVDAERAHDAEAHAV